MTTTAATTALASADPPTASTRTRAGLASLVGAGVLLALARLLTNAGGSPAERLSDMTGHDTRVAAGALLAIVGFAALIPGFLTVAARVRHRGAALATVGAGLVVLGGVAFAVLASVDLATLAATHVADRAAMEDYLGELDVLPGILVLTPFATLGYFFGPFLVTLGARRAGFVPAWLPWATLGTLVVQPVGAALAGPDGARVVDAICQLLLIGLLSVLARAVLATGSAPR